MAGESTITVTHGASNVPMEWVMYEFPAGTVWGNGSQATAAGTTFPAVGSLPDPPLPVIAAIARAASGTSGTSSAGSWGGTYTEDYDHLTLDDTVTDGVYLATAHGYSTATSITPTSTITVGGSPFGGSAEYQKVVFALTVSALISVRAAGVDVDIQWKSPSSGWVVVKSGI